MRNSRCRRTIARSLFVLLMFAVGTLPGCGYPKVSPGTYEVAKSLYSACNRQSEPHLDRAAETIARLRRSAEITAREAEWLTEIVTTARAGHWEDAMLTAREIMEDQIDR